MTGRGAGCCPCQMFTSPIVPLTIRVWDRQRCTSSPTSMVGGGWRWRTWAQGQMYILATLLLCNNGLYSSQCYSSSTVGSGYEVARGSTALQKSFIRCPLVTLEKGSKSKINLEDMWMSNIAAVQFYSHKCLVKTHMDCGWYYNTQNLHLKAYSFVFVWSMRRYALYFRRLRL